MHVLLSFQSRSVPKTVITNSVPMGVNKPVAASSHHFPARRSAQKVVSVTKALCGVVIAVSPFLSAVVCIRISIMQPAKPFTQPANAMWSVSAIVVDLFPAKNSLVALMRNAGW